MEGDLITYSKLREYQRDERNKKILIILPENIIKLINSYLKEKKIILEKNKDENNLFSQDTYSRIESELKNANKCIKNIFEIRQKKIISKAFQTSKNNLKIKDTTNMLDFEKSLFIHLIKVFNVYLEKCIISTIKNIKPSFNVDIDKKENKEKPLKSKVTISNIENNNKILIKILDNIPSFVWEDKSKKGPFKSEDLIFVPKKLGLLLIKQKKGQEVTKK